MRLVTTTLVIVLSACRSDDSPALPDASPDVQQLDNDAPPIDWAVWGQACNRPLYGATPCKATDGTGGYCVLDWTGHNTCRHACYSVPSHHSECPVDAVAIHDGYYSQGCYCARLPL